MHTGFTAPLAEPIVIHSFLFLSLPHLKHQWDNWESHGSPLLGLNGGAKMASQGSPRCHGAVPPFQGDLRGICLDGPARPQCHPQTTAPRTGLRRSYPFHSFQVPLQQTVQREGNYVVHVLNLKDKKQKNILIPFPC